MRSIGTMVCLVVLASVAAGQMVTSTARFASADLDGNGSAEFIAAGRIGPYLPVGGRALLQVSQLVSGGRLAVMAEREVGTVRDVAIGDYGLDGRLDVFTVGDGWLNVHAVAGGRLVQVAGLRLDTDWTDRLAVLGDGETALAVVTEYRIQPDRDVGTTRLRGFHCEPEGLRQVWAFDLDLHVGDLALVGGPSPHLVVEAGAGDEGGDLLVYDVSTSPVLLSQDSVTQGSRCLSIEALAQSRVVARSIDGYEHVLSLSRGRLIRLSSTTYEPRSKLVSGVTPEGLAGSVGVYVPGRGLVTRPTY